MYNGNIEINQSLIHPTKIGASLCYGQCLEHLKLRGKLLRSVTSGGLKYHARGPPCANDSRQMSLSMVSRGRKSRGASACRVG